MAQKFPEVGLRAIFEITGFNRNFKKYQTTMRDIDRITKRTAQNITQSGGVIARSLTDLLDLSPLFDGLVRGGNVAATSIKFLQESFAGLENNVGINAIKFTELISAGSTMGDAFEQAKEKTGDLDDAVSLLGGTFSKTAVAVTILTAALAGTSRLVQKSISEYTELAEATRRLSAQTGLLSREASGLVQVMQASGVSASTASRGMAQFLNRVSDLRREQQLGEESTSDFAKALDTLEISISDGDDNLKSTEQLLGEINRAFQDLGSGARTTEAAMSLFGRTGVQLLPILTDQKTSLADFTMTLERLGGSMTALDKQQYAEFLKSQIKLQAAMQGFFNNVARQWIPILGGIADVVSEVIGIYNLLVRELGGVEFSVESVARALHLLARTLAVASKMLERTIGLAKALYSVLNPLAGLYSGLAEKQEALTQSQADAAQATAEQIELEKERRKALLDTFDALGELKSKLADKLEDIDRDAERAWDDILVKRFRDAADRQLQEARKLDDLRTALNDKLDAIDQDFAKRWDDILVKRLREAIVRSISLNQRYEDLARNAAKSRSDAIRDAEDRQADQQLDLQRKIEDVQRDGQRKREKLERDHYRRLRDIQQDYLDTVTEAARSNDAVAVARAMRERAREIRDEQTRFGDEQHDLALALSEKRADIERDRQEREQDQRDELAKTLRRIEENYREQQLELTRKGNADAALRALQYQWELDDFNAAKAEQKQAASDAWIEARKDLIAAQDEAAEDRKIAYRRQLADFNKAQRRKQNDANAWYIQERNELATHLNLIGYQLERAYVDWMQDAATAASAVAKTISVTLSNEILQYKNTIRQPQEPTQGSGGLGNWTRAVWNEIKKIWEIAGSGISMAEGGVIQASSPTNVTMGDAGPETAIFLPGNAQSMSVNHSFGRMGVDFEGLPGGMNTQQVESIVYAVMAQFAKGIKVPRN